MDNKKLYIGIDLGTSAVKLVLMDQNGTVENTVSKEYPITFPRPGWAEQNPQDWIEAAEAGIQELAGSSSAAEIAGIGVSGQMHGLVILDKDDHVLRPAILWNDGRAKEETEYLNQTVDRVKLSEYTGNIAFAGFTAPKILWVRKYEPELFRKTVKIMLPKDYVNYCLTGIFATDYTDASGTLLLDVKNKKWSDEMLDICGIPVKMLPSLHESYERIGTLKKEIAARLGLPENVAVAAGAGDNAAAALGSGTIGEGKCNISLGTSGTIFISGDRFRSIPGNTLHSFVHADGSWHLMGCMLSAASCNKWWMENILDTEDFPKEQACIDRDLLGRNHVYFLPYLMGERAPYNDPDASGCFLGLTMDTRRRDMTQAVLEGVAFGLRDSLEEAEKAGVCIKSSMICGGGTKSLLWKKILANVLNLKLMVPETEQGPGCGAAMLAAVSCGAYGSVREAAGAMAKPASVLEPDPVIAARYEMRYHVYRSMYPALKEIFPKIEK